MKSKLFSLLVAILFSFTALAMPISANAAAQTGQKLAQTGTTHKASKTKKHTKKHSKKHHKSSKKHAKKTTAK